MRTSLAVAIALTMTLSAFATTAAAQTETSDSADVVDTAQQVRERVSAHLEDVSNAALQCQIVCTADGSGCLPVCPPSTTQQTCTDVCELFHADVCEGEVCEGVSVGGEDCSIECTTSSCLPDARTSAADAKPSVDTEDPASTAREVEPRTEQDRSADQLDPTTTQGCAEGCSNVELVDSDCEPRCSVDSNVDCTPCEGGVKRCEINPCTLIGQPEGCFTCTMTDAVCSPVCFVQRVLAGASTSEACTIDGPPDEVVIGPTP